MSMFDPVCVNAPQVFAQVSWFELMRADITGAWLHFFSESRHIYRQLMCLSLLYLSPVFAYFSQLYNIFYNTLHEHFLARSSGCLGSLTLLRTVLLNAFNSFGVTCSAYI